MMNNEKLHHIEFSWFTKRIVKMLASVVLVLPLLPAGCSYKVVYCPPDNEPITIMADVDKAYPVYATEYIVNFGIVTKSLNTAEASTGVTAKSKIVSFREKLNNESIRLQDRLKTALYGLQTMPCDKARRDEFWNVLRETNEKTIELRNTARRLSEAKDDPEKVMQAIDPHASGVFEQPVADNNNKGIEDLKSELLKSIQALRTDFQDYAVGQTKYIIGEVYFVSGSDILTDDAKRFLRNMERNIKREHQKQIVVLGHTDDVPFKPKPIGRFRNNMELSIGRAKNVSRFLVEELGMDPSRISLAGFSDQHHATGNAGGRSRQRSRRVNILLIPESDLFTIPAKRY